jgi:hypothetical protein
MIVSVNHALSVEEARTRVDHGLEKILRGPLPAGLELGEVEHAWKGDTLTASAKAAAGIFSLTIDGALTVSPDAVTVDFEIPAMAKAFVSEEDIEAALKRKLGEILK